MEKIYYFLFIVASMLLISVSCSDSSTNNPVSPDGGNKYNLSVIADPTEGGNVSPTSGEYNSGDSVEITASANEKWVFERWRGDHTGTVNPISITMNSDKDMVALFTERTYPLIVNTEGEGSVSERVVQAKTTDYPEGTIVELTANPSEGWRFSHWEGDSDVDDNPTEILIEEAKEVTAIFVKREYPLSITIEGEGTVSEEVVQAKSTDYPFETVVELTANSANGWVFSHWQGNVDGNDNTVTIEIDGEKNVTAVFERRDYSLTINIEGKGTVDEEVIQTKTTDYSYETNVVLTANPIDGWEFSHWQGDLDGSQNPMTIEVTEEKYVTAVFERDTYAINYTMEGEGSVSEKLLSGDVAGDGAYEYESTVELTANPDDGWMFSHWEVDAAGSVNPVTIKIESEKNVTAVFERRDYPLTINIEGEGTVDEEVVHAKTTEYPFETMVELTSNPGTGWVFSHWQGDLTGSENPEQVKVTKEMAITAVFERDTYAINYTIEGEGSVSGNLVEGNETDDGSYEYESTVELTANATDGWKFSHWEGDVEGNGNTVTIEIDGEKNVTAVFERRDYSLTVNIEGEGTVTEEVVQAKTTDYPFEAVVELSANAANGWVFSHWQGDLNGSVNPVTIEVTEEKNVTAFFSRDAFSLNYTIEGEGTVSEKLLSGGMTDDGAYEYESMVELTVNVEEGWKFSHWGGDVEGSDNPESIDIDGEKNITVFIERRDYDLAVTIEGEGTVSEEIVQGKTTSYPFQTNVRLTATASEGWVFSHWQGDLEGSENPVTIEVTENKAVTAAFERQFYLHENGVTIVCSEAKIGDSATLYGVMYTKRTKDQITTENAANTCTSSITNMESLFSGARSFNQDIGSWDVSSVTDMSSMFYNASNFNQDIGNWDVSSVKNMRLLFGNTNIFNQDIDKWDVSSVTDMYFTFYRAYGFNQDIGNWDVSKVIDMESLFRDSAFNQKIGNWDVSAVVNMHSLFRNSSFNQSVEDWDVSNVTTMQYMFANTSFNQSIGKWNVSNVTNMRSMFAVSSFNQPIENWNVSNVINMHQMFASSSFNQPIENWNVSNVTIMASMFLSSSFNQPIGDWDVGNVTNMSQMFGDSPFDQPIDKWDVSSVNSTQLMFFSSSFNQPIGNWNVSNVTNMDTMFRGSAFNQSIGNWDVSNVQRMFQMFGNSPFDQPIGNWDVRSVTNMNQMFENTPFDHPIGNWNVSNVTSMSQMFRSSQFNQDIGNWDVRSVTYMNQMFENTPFDHPIGNWNVSNVTSMSQMFRSSQFNQDIGNWDVGNVTNMNQMFENTPFDQPLSSWCVSNINSEPNNFSVNSPLAKENKPVWGTCPD